MEDIPSRAALRGASATVLMGLVGGDDTRSCWLGSGEVGVWEVGRAAAGGGVVEMCVDDGDVAAVSALAWWEEDACWMESRRAYSLR